MQGIGQLLWKLREKEGIRQKQLCLGISSVSKYARIEADQQEIDFFLIDRIMGRLGKSVERLTYILPRDIYDIYELRQEIQQKICQKKWEETCKADGAVLACDSVLANEAPDDDAVAACQALGKALC